MACTRNKQYSSKVIHWRNADFDARYMKLPSVHCTSKMSYRLKQLGSGSTFLRRGVAIRHRGSLGRSYVSVPTSKEAFSLETGVGVDRAFTSNKRAQKVSLFSLRNALL